MTEKSYVGLEQRLCIVCANAIDVGILFNTRLRNTLECNTVTGWNDKPCASCAAQMSDSDGNGERVALVVCDESNSTFLANGNVDPNGAYRTGEICFLRKSVFSQIFNCPLPPKDVAFIPPDLFAQLASIPQAQEI